MENVNASVVVTYFTNALYAMMSTLLCEKCKICLTVVAWIVGTCFTDF